MKIDPYKHKERWDRWISKVDKEGIKDLSKYNSDLIIQYLKDMAMGINISNKSKKGARSHIRLNHLQQKLIFIVRLLEKEGIKDVRKTTETQIHKLFQDMRNGIIRKIDGGVYKSAGDYVKNFKGFWHWYQKISKEEIKDITGDLDTRGEKPKFIYFDKDLFDKILSKASYDLKIVLILAFDTGMRVTELMNIRVSDFLKDYTELNIREETSKTFGRRIKLMLCSKQVREYVNKLELETNDILAQKSNKLINNELKIIGEKVLPQKKLEFKNLSLYDFRHSSACFWLPKYKSESALKYRFGWKKSDMIHYYTEFLGMKDTITQDDMFEDITKQELEKEVDKMKNQLKQSVEMLQRHEAYLKTLPVIEQKH